MIHYLTPLGHAENSFPWLLGKNRDHGLVVLFAPHSACWASCLFGPASVVVNVDVL